MHAPMCQLTLRLPLLLTAMEVFMTCLGMFPAAVYYEMENWLKKFTGSSSSICYQHLLIYLLT